MFNKKRLQKILEIGIKLILVIAAILLLANRLEEDGYKGIFTYPWQNAAFIIPAFIVLWGLNLFWDAFIWRNVHHFLTTLSWRRSFKTNFICYALSFITPANSGELAGRYVMLNGKASRQKTLFLTFWSHFPRLVVKLVLGSCAILFLSYSLGEITLSFAVSGSIALAILFLVFYFSFIRIQKWLHKKGIGKVNLADYILNTHPHQSEKAILITLSLLKYLTYNFQFVLLILLWGDVDLSWTLMLSVIVFYFITAVIPTFAAADFLVKGALAIYVFSPFLSDESLLINASFVVWLFNVAIPALVGTLIIFRTNLVHSIKKKFSRGSLYGP